MYVMPSPQLCKRLYDRELYLTINLNLNKGAPLKINFKSKSKKHCQCNMLIMFTCCFTGSHPLVMIRAVNDPHLYGDKPEPRLTDLRLKVIKRSSTLGHVAVVIVDGHFAEFLRSYLAIRSI